MNLVARYIYTGCVCLVAGACKKREGNVVKTLRSTVWLYTIGACLGMGTASNAEETILGGAGVSLAASSEIEAFVCAFNEEGGMISELVSEAYASAGFEDEPTLDFIRDPLTLDLVDIARTGRVVFPMYKPRCDDHWLLSDHTKKLCQDFMWSDPLFRVVMSGYVAADRDWQPGGNSQLIGSTVCQPKGEGSFYLRERGLTDLNAKLIVAASPKACLKMVAAGESDIAILPMMSADRALDGSDLAGAIVHAEGLDMVLSVHAIAGNITAAGVDGINMLNRGLKRIRENGVWFEVVKEHSNGHSHGTQHAAHNTN